MGPRRIIVRSPRRAFRNELTDLSSFYRLAANGSSTTTMRSSTSSLTSSAALPTSSAVTPTAAPSTGAAATFGRRTVGEWLFVGAAGIAAWFV
mgnify:FL=1